MRNLKKVLSLALALVMLVGMMVVGAGAVTYGDSASVQKGEAVDVMSAIGVFTGNDAGNFNPGGYLNRQEAAKILATVTLGPTVANRLSVSGTGFTDVPASSWASGFIAYCASENIISGADGLFRPYDLLEATDFAKMLLVAAGNDASRYVGNGWNLNVQRDALSAGLLNNVTMGAWFDPITRENAAQMALNAIQVGQDVTTTGTKYVVASTATTISTSLYSTQAADAAAVAAGTTFASVAGVVNGGQYDSFADAVAAGTGVTIGYATQAVDAAAVTAVYGVNFTVTPMTVTTTEKAGSLAQTVFGLRSTTGTDDFGNPVKNWMQGTNPQPIATVVTGAALEYTTAVTGGQLYTALGLTASSASALTVKTVVDGLETANNTIVKGYITSGNTNAIAGNGALTRVFRTGANAITITVVNTYVGTISAPVAAVVNADGQVTAKAYVNVTANGTVNPGTLANGGRFETDAFTAADKDAVVLYTVLYNSTNTNYAVDSVAKANSISATATRINTNNTFVAGGATYTYSAKVDTGKILATLTGQETVLYFDNYGNVIFTSAPQAAAANYAVILGLSTTPGSGSGTLGSNGGGNVMLLLPDGTTTTVPFAPVKVPYSWNGTSAWTTTGYADAVAATEDWGTSGHTTASATEHGALAAVNPTVFDVVTYTVGNNNTYNLSLASNTTATINNGTAGAITTSVPTIASGVVANSSTVFLVKTGSADTAYTAYTGIGAVPSLTGANSTGTAARIISNNGIASLVFLNVATVTGSSVGSNEVVFVAGTGLAQVDLVNGQPVTTYVHQAVVNGQITTVTVRQNDAGNASLITANTLATGVVRNDQGVITNITPASTTLSNGTGALDVNKVSTAALNGVIHFQKDSNAATPYLYNESTAVYAVANGAIVSSNINAVDTNDTVVAVYVVNNVVAAVYYTPVA